MRCPAHTMAGADFSLSYLIGYGSSPFPPGASSDLPRPAHSGLPRTTDIVGPAQLVRFVPIASFAATSRHLQSVAACLKLARRRHRTHLTETNQRCLGYPKVIPDAVE